MTVPLVLSVVLCGATAWLTLLSGRSAVEAREAQSGAPPDDGTAPDREADSRVFIAGETQ